MQYLIIEELQTLMKKLLETDHFILLTHNKLFLQLMLDIIISTIRINLLDFIQMAQKHK